MKKILAMVLTIITLLSLATVPAAAQYDLVYIYSPNGGSSLVKSYELDYYCSRGWYPYPVQTMYSIDGRETIIRPHEVEYYKSLGWYTEPIVTMYAIDGRTTLILQSEIEYYKSLGWYAEPLVTMYSFDGRTTLILQSEIGYYTYLGWYTEDEYRFLAGIDEYVAKYGYASAAADLEAWFEIYENYDHMQEAIAWKYLDIMERWYAATGTPIIVEDWYRSQNSIGTPEINIIFRNISPKTITSFVANFTCYDVYGNETTDYPSLYNGTIDATANCGAFEAYDTEVYQWTLYSNKRTASISWPQIANITFEDGSVWYNN